MPLQSRTEKLDAIGRSMDARRELSDPELAAGDSTQVRRTLLGNGHEFMVLRARAIPSFAAFNKKPAEIIKQYRERAAGAMGGWSYQGRVFALGERMNSWTRAAGARIRILIPLEQEQDGEREHQHQDD